MCIEEMAAGQQKKRLNSTSITRFNLHEQQRVNKKKKLESSDSVWYMKPHISLEWDDSQKQAVARKEQVAIAWRDMSPFASCFPRSRSGLADIFSVPMEIFELDDMTDVLSFEVWQKQLSASERNFLTQFLPKEANSDEVVLSLLRQDNLNFGNPFSKWSSSLCSGNLHPDIVLHQTCILKANKKLYYSGLKKYHDGVVGKLLIWKQTWLSCKNHEEDFVAKLLRNDGVNPDPGNLQVVSAAAKHVISRNKHPKKICNGDGDIASYMSCFKISRAHHQLIKNIKHSGEGIQSKSLYRVLGDITEYNLQPYKAFQEEEREKSHKHWLQLACNDLPVAFKHFNEVREKRKQWKQSVEEELAEKKMINEEEKENLETLSFQQGESVSEKLEHLVLEASQSGEPRDELNVNDQTDVCSASPCKVHDAENNIFHHGQCETNYVTSECQGTESTASDDILKSPGGTGSKFLKDENLTKDAGLDTPLSVNKTQLEMIPSHNGCEEQSPMVLDEEENKEILNPVNDSQVTVDYADFSKLNANNAEPTISASAKNMWADVGIQDSYHEPATQSHMGTAFDKLSLRQTCVNKAHPANYVNSRSDLLDFESAQSVSSALNKDNGAQFLGSYSNQDCNLLLPAFTQLQTLSSYGHENVYTSAKPDFPFVSRASNGCTQSDGFISTSQDQGKSLQLRQTRQRELFVQPPVVHGNTYPSNRYISQGNLLPEPQGWASLTSPMNGGLLGHNFFPGQLPVPGSLLGVQPSFSAVDQCLGNGGNSNGSLFAALPDHIKYQSNFSCDSSASEHLGSVGELIGRGMTGLDPLYGFSSNQLNIVRNRETAAGSQVSDMSWLNIPNQNLDTHDPMLQSYLRSWK